MQLEMVKITLFFPKVAIDHFRVGNSIVAMWVHEELVDGRNLTEIINSEHVNQKYLPDILLSDNIVVRFNLCLPIT